MESGESSCLPYIQRRGGEQDGRSCGAAELLIEAGYTTETELLAATEEDLRAAQVRVPVARLILKIGQASRIIPWSFARSLFVSLFNSFDTFKQQQQHQNGTSRRCFCILVLVFYSASHMVFLIFCLIMSSLHSYYFLAGKSVRQGQYSATNASLLLRRK